MVNLNKVYREKIKELYEEKSYELFEEIQLDEFTIEDDSGEATIEEATIEEPEVKEPIKEATVNLDLVNNSQKRKLQRMIEKSENGKLMVISETDEEVELGHKSNILTTVVVDKIVIGS